MGLKPALRIAVLPLLLAACPAAHATTPSLMVCYLEAPAARAARLAQNLEAYVAAGTLPGGISVQVLRELGRSNRFAILEHGPDITGNAPRTDVLQARVAGETEAPADCRLNNALTPLITAAKAGAAFHVLMHVDVAPAGSDLASKALLAQRSAVLSAPGGLGFEAAVETGRSNHFAVHEIWSSRAAYEAYAATRPAADLRRQLIAIKGAPFDDRFYAAIVSAPPH